MTSQGSATPIYFGISLGCRGLFGSRIRLDDAAMPGCGLLSTSKLFLLEFRLFDPDTDAIPFWTAFLSGGEVCKDAFWVEVPYKLDRFFMAQLR